MQENCITSFAATAAYVRTTAVVETAPVWAPVSAPVVTSRVTQEYPFGAAARVRVSVLAPVVPVQVILPA